MINYIKADLYRIRSKRGHNILLLLTYILLIVITIFKSNNETSYIELSSMLPTILMIFFGINVFFSVFSEDSKAGTMQIAIGKGLTRKTVIITKALEGLYLTTIYYVIAGLLITIVPLVMHLSLSSSMLSAVWICIIESILDTVLYFNSGMIILLATFKSNLAEITFILFALTIIPDVINIGLGLCTSNLGMPNLVPYVYSNIVSDFLANPIKNIFDVIGIVVYLVISIVLSIEIFKKKELEF